MKWYTLTAQAAIKKLTSSQKGLPTQLVKNRQAQYGPNRLETEKRRSPVLLFLDQFKSFIIYILLFAIILSTVQGEYVDAIVILIILLTNAIVGFIQEYKAEKAINALKELSAHKVLVRRNNKEVEVAATEIVPGDIMLVREGVKIPADGRILKSLGFYVDESSLTGESVPVEKKDVVLEATTPLAERDNMVYSGTLVTRGRAEVLVTSIGMKTEIGKIAKLISSVESLDTPLQRKLDSLGKKIGIITLIICGLILIAGLLTEGSFASLLDKDTGTFLAATGKWLLLAVALAVAAVPEGLPAIVTIALSIGVKRMVKRNALIRHLPSVETLGETTVICTDKTGTLTKNEMTVIKYFYDNKVGLITGTGYDRSGDVDLNAPLLFTIGVRCNDAKLHKKTISGDPTEAALLVSAAKAGIKDDRDKLKIIDEESFDSTRKMMSLVYDEPEKKVYTKGAPEKVLAKCTHILLNGKVKAMDATTKRSILAQNKKFASEALRVLAFAYKPYKPKEKLEEKLIFVGLQAMIDPPRTEVKKAIATCNEAGIRVMMITGDNATTAEAIAKHIGLKGKAVEGAVFSKASPAEKRKLIREVCIFARVEPEHKMAIVSTLQAEGHVVAMTGDGVNDAPAIKKADLGIAMGITGTDVAKESSEMILLDDNFSSIVSAVEEGRGIFTNIKKFVNYLLSSNLGEVLVIFFAVLLFGVDSLPLTAIMLLWLNLVTDGLPALALSVDPIPPKIMKEAPINASQGIMTKRMFNYIIFVASLITIAVLGLFKWAEAVYGDMVYMQTIAFTAIIIFEFVRLQTIRAEDNLGLFSNTWLLLAVAASIGLQLLVVYSPLSSFFGTAPLHIFDWMVILGVAVLLYVINVFAARFFTAKPKTTN